MPDEDSSDDPSIRSYEFTCYFKTISKTYSLWLSDKLLDGNFDVKRTRVEPVDLDQYLDDSTLPPSPESDCDCDGIARREDPDPNNPNLVFKAGMNLYHHPFHPIEQGKMGERIELSKLFNSHLHLFDKACFFKNQTEAEPQTGWAWYDYPMDSNSNDIFLSYKAGCLLYLPENLNLSGEKYKWGICFSEALSQSIFDPNNLVIELNPGLNIPGLTYYEAFTLSGKHEFRSFQDQCVNSFDLIRSINSPTTSRPSQSVSLTLNSSMNVTMNVIDKSKAEVTDKQKTSSSILRYDAKKGKWGYTTTIFDQLAGEGFVIGIDEAYLLYLDIQQDQHTSVGKNWYPAIFWP